MLRISNKILPYAFVLACYASGFTYLVPDMNGVSMRVKNIRSGECADWLSKELFKDVLCMIVIVIV
jgi:hypothetical protein